MIKSLECIHLTLGMEDHRFMFEVPANEPEGL